MSDPEQVSSPKPIYHVRLAGRDYPVRYGFKAQNAFCEHKGWKLSALMDLSEDLAFGDLPALILIGMRDAAEKEGRAFTLTESDVVDLLDDDETDVLGERGAMVQAVNAFLHASKTGESRTGQNGQAGAGDEAKKKPMPKAKKSPGTRSSTGRPKSKSPKTTSG